MADNVVERGDSSLSSSSSSIEALLARHQHLQQQLQQPVTAHKEEDEDDPSAAYFDLGVLLWEKGKESKEIRAKAAENFVACAKLRPQNAALAFRYLGHYYSQVSVDYQRAIKCYQRAITLSPHDSESGEILCDLLDKEGNESLQVAVCREASEKSPRAFWAFQRLGYLQVHLNNWSEAVPCLQHSIRGYPTSADLWEALGLAYQRLGMFTAAIKSYGRAIELESSRIFAMIESGNINLMLGSFRKGIEQFQLALQISPHNTSAQYGLASGLLVFSKECINSGAFKWGASLLEEASNVVRASTCLAGNHSCIWKLHGDIQVAYAKCMPWLEEELGATIGVAFTASIHSWRRACHSSAVSALNSYQRALHLKPWQANIYMDIAVASDIIFSLEERSEHELNVWQLPEKMSSGALLLEAHNNEFWVALGCLCTHSALKQHAFIRGLQIDVSLASAWAYLGKLYGDQCKKQMASQAFDRARSIDPSLALPWAGMSADIYAGKLTRDEAYESCLRAVQIMPLAEFQIGLANLALLSGHLSSTQVFGAVQQAVRRAPYYPEAHNLKGLVYEARLDFKLAADSYMLARCAINTLGGNVPKSYLRDISINLARALSRGGNAVSAAQECEDLSREGLLDVEGLQIYAFSLWHLGKNDQVLTVAKDLISRALSIQGPAKESSVSLICRLLYSISGLQSVATKILKMPEEFIQSSKVSFVISAIHALDRCNQLELVVTSSRRSLVSHEDITRMHFLIALSKLIKQGSDGCLGIQSGVKHLCKVLHVYPNSELIRNLLGYLHLSSKEWKESRIASRCLSIGRSRCLESEGLKSAYEIIGAGMTACYSMQNSEKVAFPTCDCQFLHETRANRLLQKWLHEEPWNYNAKYLLVITYLQKARLERFPQHLNVVLGRLLSVVLSTHMNSTNDGSSQYRKFQLLLCASEISLQGGDLIGCTNHANCASELLLPDNYLFFTYLQLCRIYAAQGDYPNLHEKFMRCLELKTDYPIAWVCLKFVESQYKLQTDLNLSQLCFNNCSKEMKNSLHMWVGVFSLVQGLASWTKDSLLAEKLLAQACSLPGTESCFFACHGAICMELARQLGDSHFLSLAIRSLKKARGQSAISLPIVSLLLGQAEGSLGFQEKWETNLRLEWFAWPPEIRPAELYLQMHLVSLKTKYGADYEVESRVEISQSSSHSWILRAIHLNPTCMRYWRVLDKFLGDH